MARLHSSHAPLHLSLSPNNLRSRSKPPSSSLHSLSFRTLGPPPKFTSARASSSSSDPGPPRRPDPPRALQTACVAFSAAAALFLARFHLKLKPAVAVAAPIAAPPEVETRGEEPGGAGAGAGEEERAIEEHLSQYGDDVEALRSLMEAKIKSRKLQEAIGILGRLIELEPEEREWPLLKANIYSYSGEFESAKRTFEEILDKDPLRVEAYHGLVMAASEAGDELKELLERIKVAMQRCKKEKKKSEVRDFKLLVAQVRVIEGKYNEALSVYQELVKEEPRDFRPYLCQGILYTLLRKQDEAEKQFKQYRRLVPKNHPYAEYFDDNMFATKFFAQKVERERAGMKS
ncbi:hypothetical protein ACJRO7_001124 [Eucalyptus globulus]|uniref:Chloroplast lumen common family protein n=1 Tax=Eucalyptus globulus TaxID=34317 RepID=A0ABD3LV87_EUCGL